MLRFFDQSGLVSLSYCPSAANGGSVVVSFVVVPLLLLQRTDGRWAMLAHGSLVSVTPVAGLLAPVNDYMSATDWLRSLGVQDNK